MFNQFELTKLMNSQRHPLHQLTAWSQPPLQQSFQHFGISLPTNGHESLDERMLDNNCGGKGFPSVLRLDQVFTQAEYVAMRQDFNTNGYNDVSWPIQEWSNKEDLPETSRHINNAENFLESTHLNALNLHENKLPNIQSLQQPVQIVHEVEDQYKSWSQTLKADDAVWAMDEMTVVETEVKRKKSKKLPYEVSFTIKCLLYSNRFLLCSTASSVKRTESPRKSI